jgi:hypothetical protein
MKHVSPGGLDELEGLLRQLRAIDGLTEKKRGVFYRGSRAFLHFHEDGSDLYAEQRLSGPRRRCRNLLLARSRSSSDR